MDLHHTETAKYGKDSLRKMRIPFLKINKLVIPETECRVDIDTNKDLTNAGLHQHHNSVVADGDSHPRDRPIRVERRVAYQSSMLGTHFDSSYAAYRQKLTLRDQGQSPIRRAAEQLYDSQPRSRNALSDPQGFSDYRVLPDDLDLVQLNNSTSVSSERFLSSRFVCVDDERLFVMYSRVIGSMSWQDISKIFEIIFGREGNKHTVPGLIRIYNLTRRDWGMNHEKRRGMDPCYSDEMVVKAKINKHAGMFRRPQVRGQTWHYGTAR